VRFQGKFDELSPRARFRVALGYVIAVQYVQCEIDRCGMSSLTCLVCSGARPFDRHDWVIDRCGKEVRYIIDYYDTPSKSIHPNANITLHIRPAYDSVGAVIDRVRMNLVRAYDKLFQ
jgi:hypothetical protein